jgi:signal transduction histidine kinase
VAKAGSRVPHTETYKHRGKRPVAWLAPGARRHVTRFLRAIESGLSEPAPISGITPVAAARARSLDSFFLQVEQRGRELARAGARLEDITLALREFDLQVGAAVRERFQPAREQLQLATDFALHRAFYEAREEEVRRLQSLARHAEEQERRRIGRELHDEAGQSLLLLRLQLEMLERSAPKRIRGDLAEARGTAGRIVTELRRIVAALSPAVLERMGLVPALRQLAARVEKSCGIAAGIRVRGAAAGLPVEAQEVVYRVAQESLQNTAKHAQATAVNLSLEITDKSIRLRVRDNGAGFTVETASSRPGSFGLAGMRERAELLGGALEVRSAPGRGSAIVLRLPVSTTVMPDAQNSCATD